jgi:hypothetical protein
MACKHRSIAMMVVSIIDAWGSQFLGVFGGSDLSYGSPI